VIEAKILLANEQGFEGDILVNIYEDTSPSPDCRWKLSSNPIQLALATRLFGRPKTKQQPQITTTAATKQ
jgi:hypothetical protein